MLEKVDTGSIISVSYFEISEYETVESLKLKSMNHLLFLYHNVIDNIFHGRELPISDEKWEVKPYSKKQLQDLSKIEPSMDESEVRLRVRATDYSSQYDGAYIELAGEKFYKRSNIGTPIV